MRVFRLTEKKLIYLVLTNVGIKKNFFSVQMYNCDMPQTFLISTDSLTKIEKNAILFYFSFFSYLKGSNLEAASLACINDFIDKKFDEMIKDLKIQRLNRKKLGLKSKTNYIAISSV